MLVKRCQPNLYHPLLQVTDDLTPLLNAYLKTPLSDLYKSRCIRLPSSIYHSRFVVVLCHTWCAEQPPYRHTRGRNATRQLFWRIWYAILRLLPQFVLIQTGKAADGKIELSSPSSVQALKRFSKTLFYDGTASVNSTCSAEGDDKDITPCPVNTESSDHSTVSNISCACLWSWPLSNNHRLPENSNPGIHESWELGSDMPSENVRWKA